MNVRRQLYKKYRLSGLSAYQAALKSGYSISTAEKAGSVLEKNGDFQAILVKAGIDDLSLANLISEGLQANKVISCNIIAPNGEGMKDANSMTKDFVDVPDWQARHKFLETVLKLTGKLKDTVLNNNGITLIKMGDVVINQQTLEFNVG